jgi:hypothetical protein
MSERTYWRDLTYHLFHRKESAKRFIDESMADILRMRDVDCVEHCYACGRPLALIEVKAGARRSVYVEPLIHLADRAGLPAFVVFYRRSRELNPVYLGETNLDGTPIRDIEQLTVVNAADGSAMHLAPAEFFEWLLELHLACTCSAAVNIRRRRGEGR